MPFVYFRYRKRVINFFLNIEEGLGDDQWQTKASTRINRQPLKWRLANMYSIFSNIFKIEFFVM